MAFHYRYTSAPKSYDDNSTITVEETAITSRWGTPMRLVAIPSDIATWQIERYLSGSHFADTIEDFQKLTVSGYSY